ncbi:MAG: PEGA domain-containing protein [Nannocystaceae bacterium]|nr:PEGA domain-containing protein [Nannocystaceae bacterium]
MAGNSADAAVPAIEVARPKMQGEVPRAWSDKVRARLVLGLSEGGLESATTATALSAEARAERHLRAALTLHAMGRDYELELVVTDVETGEVVATVAETCDTCGFAELGDTVEAVATAAVRALWKGSPPAAVKLRSLPLGAEVTVDGTVVGTTPLELSLTAGEHMLGIAADGFVSHRRRFSVVSGELLSVDASLAPVVSDLDLASEAARRRRVAVGSAAVVAGVAGVATGVALLIMHGKPVMRDCAGTDVDLDGDCRFLHDTRTWGSISTGVGAAFVVAGATVLGITLAKGRRGRLRAGISPRYLSLEARF